LCIFLLHWNCFASIARLDVGMTGRGVGVVVAALLVAVISVIAAIFYILYRYVLIYDCSKIGIPLLYRLIEALTTLRACLRACCWYLLDIDALLSLLSVAAIGRRKSLKPMKWNEKKR
jgi:hypothetical protein